MALKLTPGELNVVWTLERHHPVGTTTDVRALLNIIRNHFPREKEDYTTDELMAIIKRNMFPDIAEGNTWAVDELGERAKLNE